MRCAILLLICLALGCSDKPTLYHGKPVSDWVAQTKGGKPAVRMEAYFALRFFPSESSALSALREAASDVEHSPSERFVAAQNLYRATGDSKEVLDPVRSAIRQSADYPAGLGSTRELEDLIFWLGVQAQPLLPDLQYTESKIPVSGWNADRTRHAALQRIIDSIPR